MKHGTGAICSFAALMLALAGSASAATTQEPPFHKQTGAVQSYCQREPKTHRLVCVVVYGKQPYLGVQLGSENDPESVAITAGVRRAPNSKIEVRIDNRIGHATAAAGFLGYEAESMLHEIEGGKRVTVHFQSTDQKVKTEGTFDLADFKTALREVEALRDVDSGK
jgi:hypothetical protein